MLRHAEVKGPFKTAKVQLEHECLKTYMLMVLTTVERSDSGKTGLRGINICRDSQQQEHPAPIVEGKLVTYIDTLILPLLC